jgi:hypothetical protein
VSCADGSYGPDADDIPHKQGFFVMHVDTIDIFFSQLYISEYSIGHSTLLLLNEDKSIRVVFGDIHHPLSIIEGTYRVVEETYGDTVFTVKESGIHYNNENDSINYIASGELDIIQRNDEYVCSFSGMTMDSDSLKVFFEGTLDEYSYTKF